MFTLVTFFSTNQGHHSLQTRYFKNLYGFLNFQKRTLRSRFTLSTIPASKLNVRTSACPNILGNYNSKIALITTFVKAVIRLFEAACLLG